VGPPDLVQHVRLAFAEALSNPASSLPLANHGQRELARHGLLAAPLRHALRCRVLSEVVAPCAEALLQRAVAHAEPARAAALDASSA